MEGFVCFSECIVCGVQTDRNGVCVCCGKTITAYRVLHEGKMWLVFSDGDQMKPIAPVKCQRCGCSLISDSFESEGTCWKCRVHNTIKVRVMGQWRFYQYRVTLAPCTLPVKNVIKEMDEDMSKKFVYSGGIGKWVEESSPKTGHIEDILDEVWQESSIPVGDMKAHIPGDGIVRHVGFVSCLSCGGRTTRIDKTCGDCDTSNDIVIRRSVSGDMVVANVTRPGSSRDKPFLDELKVIKCFWCPDKKVSAALKCPRCNRYFDAVMQRLISAEAIDGITYQSYHHEVHLYVHDGERPENAIDFDVPKSLINKSSETEGDFPPFPNVMKSAQSAKVVASSSTSSAPAPSTSLVIQRKQPPAVVEVEAKKKGVIDRVFGRNGKTDVSDRTKRRHTKAEREAAYKREQHVARRLKKEGHSNRQIAVMLSDKFGKKISRTKVKGYFADD